HTVYRVMLLMKNNCAYEMQPRLKFRRVSFLSVDEAVFKHKLRALKTVREFLADGLLDDARAGETNQRAGLRDVEVAEHGEAGGKIGRAYGLAWEMCLCEVLIS